ncbi:hypothetical protein NQ318_009140 [Aromia moschata]|uniref:Uncharacterized protein n=1 Tax=Aromia moschata TaxID=1265417 RepID=A0AAV8XAN3_9CUCU|nr:hypothetical protein NQ318_009140 [Aromia moschata]
MENYDDFKIDGVDIQNANSPSGSSPLIRWPPRSPDITPLDFFLWGTIKNKVYATRPQIREELSDRIREAYQSITRQQLRNVIRNNRRRIEKCIRELGGLIEMTTI